MLKYSSNKDPVKFEWFVKMEKEIQQTFIEKTGAPSHYGRFLNTEITYEEIKNYKSQLDLFDEDFNECDSGHCSL